MENINAPAFPVSSSSINGHQNGVNTYQFTGITIRDYFAAKIVASLLQTASGAHVGVSYPEQNKNFALAAYALVDAMMEARSN